MVMEVGKVVTFRGGFYGTENVLHFDVSSGHMSIFILQKFTG